MYLKKGGATSQTIEVFIQDSSVTTGAGLTGLVYNTSNLVASYVRPGAARAAITLATQTASGAWSSGGFVEIDATNMPGWYRLDVPDAAIAASVDHVGIALKGAANMAPCNVVITLTAFDPQDSVRLGLTALPNAAAQAAGGLYTRGTGAGQINQTNNGRIDADVQSIAANAITATSIATDAITAGKIAADAIGASELAADAVAEIQSGLSTVDAAGIRSAVGLASANLDTQLSSISTATNAGGLTTKTADSSTLTTGTNTSGSVTDTSSDNDTYWITAPVTPAVGGFGLRQQLVFNLPLGRIPISIFIRGYWNGNGRVADVYALNNRTGVYDKLTNTGSNLAHRTTETAYTLTLPRDYADNSGGSFNIVTLEFRSTSTTTTDRLRLDQVLVAHVAEEVATTFSAPTVDQIWAYTSRTLTEPGSEPVAAPSAEAIADAVWDEAIADHTTAGSTGKVLDDLAGGTVTVGDVTLAASQPNYAPALAGDAMTLTSAYDAAKTAAQAGDAMSLTSGERDAIAAALLDLASGVETSLTVRKALRLMAASLGGKVSGGGTTEITFRDTADSKDRIVATVDASGNRTAITTDLT